MPEQNMPERNMNHSDVIIVGAGLSGIGAAHHLRNECPDKTFTILVLKTRTALPYSSVFIELDSAYWDVDSERELRRNMEAADRAEAG